MSLLDTGRDLRRANQLAAILLKYGFGDVIRRLGLAAPLEQAGKWVRAPIDRELVTMPTAQRLRCALEEMGPTFVKLGQILATRVDMFPREWIDEFENLQDNAPALPWSTLEPLIDKALGKPANTVFRHIDPVPLGVASIGQVHRATTRRGEAVVLKIQKPGIRDKIDSDLRLLRTVARLAVDNSAELRRYRPLDLVREFERSLSRELDFTIEARNADRIRSNLSKLKWVEVPKVYWQWTSATLSVQQLIEGIPARQLEKLDAAGVDRPLVARRGAAIAWKMALEDGFFHADPHPGNFLIMTGNRIGMLDYGMVGKLSPQRQEQMVQIVKAVVLQEPEGCAAVLARWSDGMPVDMEALTADIEDVISLYYGVPLSELDVGGLLNDITGLIRNHNLILPPDMALLIKAIITLEGFGRLIHPDFDVMSEAEPLIKRMLRTRYSPVRLARSLGLRALDAVDRLYAPPSPAGPTPNGSQGIDPRHLERLVRHMERSQYRQIQALMVLAGVVSGAIMLGGRVPPSLWDISIPGLLVFLGSSVWAGWLMLVSRRYLREWE